MRHTASIRLKACVSALTLSACLAYHPFFCRSQCIRLILTIELPFQRSRMACVLRSSRYEYMRGYKNKLVTSRTKFGSCISCIGRAERYNKI